MAKAVWGVSSVVFVGLLGVVVGVLAERIARVFGRLYCETSDCETRFTTATLNPFGLYKEIEPEQANTSIAKRVEYRFAIDVFARSGLWRAARRYGCRLLEYG